MEETARNAEQKDKGVRRSWRQRNTLDHQKGKGGESKAKVEKKTRKNAEEKKESHVNSLHRNLTCYYTNAEFTQ